MADPRMTPATPPAEGQERSEGETSGESVQTADHAHEWQAHGLVRVNKESRSPCSTWDDVLYQAVYAVQSCVCGKIKRTHVANENERRRGDDLRRTKR